MIPRPPITARLEHWEVITRDVPPLTDPAIPPRILVGDVYNHPRHADGTRIDTGTVRGAEGRVAWTRRTAYELGQPSEGYVDWCNENGTPIDPENPFRWHEPKEQP